ncbi:TIM-barrel domain-containing protein [Pedobacter sp. GR22-6]|uniref:TIM-barrel domain-containing protein n=1 Tax=Pedobacter sp. GR22-6 TaxID=3127957 RepID=UPI00307E2FD1
MIVLVLWLVLGLCPLTFGQEGEAMIRIQKKNYRLLIRKQPFAFAFQDVQGKQIADFHEISGLNAGWSGKELRPATRLIQIITHNDTLFSAWLSTDEDLKLKVDFKLGPDLLNLKVQAPQKTDAGYSIEARTAGFGPAYGLGDHGGYGQSTNVFGYSNDNFMNTTDGSRFISSFAIFPRQGFAQVVFEKASKRVGINSKENKLGANKVQDINIYYFFGMPQHIYASYAKVRTREGYPEFKPKYDFFDVGYEAFGSLGWNTAQVTVEKDLRAYLQRGYPLKWAVVGSGFWKGDRKSPTEGSTNSFGIWDDTYQEGRKDDLANPRYPDVPAFKKFFRDQGINLILGIRVNFKASTARGGFNEPLNDGVYTEEGTRKAYFVKDQQQQPKLFSAVFPKGNVYILDGYNPAAAQWFYEGAKKWEAMGWKEDTMMKDGRLVMDDAKANKANEILMNNGYYVMVRNSAYSVPGEILRIEDTQYGHGQDRPLINVLNFAASAAPNTYPDIVGGKYHVLPLKEDVKRYFVRNALFAAVCPAMSLGLGPWHLENPGYEQAVKRAADWHHEFAPYIYSAALESYYSGYPVTMTPLPIAYPADSATYELANKTRRQYSWMLGPSLLACPAYGEDYATALSRDVYLPAGKWMDYESAEVFSGSRTLKNYAFPDSKIPVFIGGKAVLVKASGKTFEATVYPLSSSNSSYTFHYPDGISSSEIRNANLNWDKPGLVVRDAKSRKVIKAVYTKKFKSYTFPIVPGHDYVLRNK